MRTADRTILSLEDSCAPFYFADVASSHVHIVSCGHMTTSPPLSILIPARNEKFLQKTVDDILAKAQTEIEVVVVLDGPTEHKFSSADPRVRIVQLEKAQGMRPAINAGVAAAKGEYLMKIDGHCMVSKGFDKVLTMDCEKDWVVIPRRKRLDADNWEVVQVEGKPGRVKPDIDYEFLSFPGDPKDWGSMGLHGKQWNSRSVDRLNTPVDENMSFQGSCWFMRKDYFVFLDLMDDANYGIFVNEAQEIGLKCWLSGGKVMINKNCWYAHLHKGKKHGRGYHINVKDIDKGNQFVNKWLTNATGWKKQTLPLSWLVEHFWPVPSWPENWKELLPEICKLSPAQEADGN